MKADRGGEMRYRKRAAQAAAFCVGLMALTSSAATIEGHVTNVSTGRGLEGAQIVWERGTHFHGPSAITVFADQDGNYKFPDTPDAELAGSIKVRMLGFRQQFPGKDPISVEMVKGSQGVDFGMIPVANVANEAPASAFMNGIPESDAKHFVQLQCTGCHQFPSPKVRHFAEQVEAVAPMGERTQAAIGEWRKQVRKEAWRYALQYMRVRSYDIFPNGTMINAEGVPWDTVQKPENSEFTSRDEEEISTFLAQNMPRQFDALLDYRYEVPLAVNGATVIREFELPRDANVREVTSVRGSKYYWGVDIEQNRLLRLDPATGEQKWIPVPSKEATGPHTIISDRSGNVWISLLETDRLAKYEPVKDKWTFWSLKPSDVKTTHIYGGQAIVHDISFDSNYELAVDSKQQIWLSLIGLNKMASLDPKSGSVHYYDTEQVPGRNAINVALYGTLLSLDGNCAWYSQLTGGFACFNTKTLKNESAVKLPEGSAPRRMAIDSRGTLWVPLFGSGQLIKYDSIQRKELARYKLPDTSSAPYVAFWDPGRDVVWLGTSDADVIYRFDPKTEKFSILPLPRPMAYLRRLGVDYQTGDLITTYANIPTGSGPSMIVTVHLSE
jgi:streptogramin lyase